MIELGSACLFGALTFAFGLIAGVLFGRELAQDKKTREAYERGLVDAFGIAGAAQDDLTKRRARELMHKSIEHMEHLRRVK